MDYGLRCLYYGFGIMFYRFMDYGLGFSDYDCWIMIGGV